MNDQSNQVPEFIHHDGEANKLWQYVSSMSPETISQLSQPASHEVFQVIERNITGMLGNLPPEHFGMMVTTSREQLGRLLASAMMSGYFLKNAEQRMFFDRALQLSESKWSHPSSEEGD